MQAEPGFGFRQLHARQGNAADAAGIRFTPMVFINGEEVGNWSDSYIPFAFDITDQVHAGDNELLVKIAPDATCGLFEDYNANRRGIYQDVFLKFVPEVRVTPDAFVQTSVSREEITYEVFIVRFK